LFNVEDLPVLDRREQGQAAVDNEMKQATALKVETEE
jgi:hypothetical protein